MPCMSMKYLSTSRPLATEMFVTLTVGCVSEATVAVIFPLSSLTVTTKVASNALHRHRDQPVAHEGGDLRGRRRHRRLSGALHCGCRVADRENR